MDKSTEDVLAIVLAVAFWVFLLVTPLGGAILDAMIGFYGSFS